jgi:hypothetical protein
MEWGGGEKRQNYYTYKCTKENSIEAILKLLTRKQYTKKNGFVTGWSSIKHW